jgi:hypothetical protein
MNVFVSWSGAVSQQVATALRKWLPYMLHSLKPFMSTVDIRSGDKWNADLAHELKQAQHGIVCVTPFNVHKPWMNFEAGALTHLLQLTPFLFRVNRAALGHSPLAQFQLTEYGQYDDRNSAEFYRLIDSLNRSLPESDQLSSDVLLTNFTHWWPQLRSDLDKIPDVSIGETRTSYKWLLTFEDLAIFEASTKYEMVWVVTSDVVKYALRSGMTQKIEAGLEKVQYRYLIPEPIDASQSAALAQLKELAEKHSDRVEFACFKHDVFEKQATSDYVICQSHLSDTNGLRVFVRIPIADSETEYWFDTDDRAALGFHSRFHQLWESRSDQA